VFLPGGKYAVLSTSRLPLTPAELWDVEKGEQIDSQSIKNVGSEQLTAVSGDGRFAVSYNVNGRNFWRADAKGVWKRHEFPVLRSDSGIDQTGRAPPIPFSDDAKSVVTCGFKVMVWKLDESVRPATIPPP
jgi:hypothetical protein